MKGDRIRLVVTARFASGCAATTDQAVPGWSDVKRTNDTWHVEGTVADACQCIIFCPCEFQSLPSEGLCDDTAVKDKNRLSPDEKTTKVELHATMAPGIGEVRIAHSTAYDYTTEGRAWHYGGRSASFRSFTLEGKTAPQ